MQFYSFRFGDMKVAQADAASPKLIAVEMSFGFKAADAPAVGELAVTVHVPHDEAKTVAATQKEAYAAAGRLFEAAAELLQTKSADDLAADTEENRAFPVTAG
jgi:microcystin degradation protein MlrC